MRAWPDDRVALGGDVNPEQWPREAWDQDIAPRGRAGVSLVTPGGFSWSRVEPAAGEYELRWPDDVMDRLAPSTRTAPVRGHDLATDVRVGGELVLGPAHAAIVREG